MGEGTCLALAVSYALTVLYQIKLGVRKLVISPQILIDINIKTLGSACPYLTNTQDPSCRGLESNEDDHYTGTRVISTSEFQDGKNYKLGEANICYEKDIKEIIKNFCPTGSKYFFVSFCKICRLSNPNLALATFGGKLFSHANYLEDLEDPEDTEYERQLSEEDGHAVVITCVNTMSDDHNEHYVVIKSSYGAEWGLKGYARVAFDFFDEILVPRLDKECRGK
ncbi:transducin/WD40 repeat-like superfamily protein [Tanacetum coccineum]